MPNVKVIIFSISVFCIFLQNSLNSHLQISKQIYSQNYKAQKIGEQTFVIKRHIDSNIPVKHRKTHIKHTPDTKKVYTLLKQYNSPLIHYVDLIYSKLPKDKADRLIAIAGVESSFGTKGYIAINCHNAWGYLYTGGGMRGCGSAKWNNWNNSITRYIELEQNNYLAGNNLNLYCQSGCTNWFKNYYYFLNKL